MCSPRPLPFLSPLPAVLLTVLLAGCGGGGGGSSGPAATQQLLYTDPPVLLQGSGWRWVRDPASTPTRLLLDLEGPGAGVAGRGVVFTLQADPQLAWSPISPSGTAPVANLGFDLGTGIPLCRYAVQGGALTAGLFQKGRGGAIPLGGPLAQVALAANGPLAPGQALTLAVQGLQLFPETGTALEPQPCAVGTLVAQSAP